MITPEVQEKSARLSQLTCAVATAKSREKVLSLIEDHLRRNRDGDEDESLSEAA